MNKTKLLSVLVITFFMLVIVTGSVRIFEDNRVLRQEVHALKVTACPPSLMGQHFTYSDYLEEDASRPKHARLTCWYASGVRL